MTIGSIGAGAADVAPRYESNRVFEELCTLLLRLQLTFGRH